jgi:hypothetical protein
LDRLVTHLGWRGKRQTSNREKQRGGEEVGRRNKQGSERQEGENKREHGNGEEKVKLLT